MGCSLPTYDRASAALMEQAFAEQPGLTEKQRRDEEYALLSMALPLAVPLDSARLRRRVDTQDYLWRAQRALVTGNTAEVRAILERIALAGVQKLPLLLLAQNRGRRFLDFRPVHPFHRRVFNFTLIPAPVEEPTKC